MAKFEKQSASIDHIKSEFTIYPWTPQTPFASQIPILIFSLVQMKLGETLVDVESKILFWVLRF